MTVSADLISGDAAPPPDTSAIPAFIFPSQSGAGSAYQFNPGDDVYSTLGASDGEEDVYWFMRTAKQPCVASICASVSGSLSSVTHSGTGPSVTAALTGSLAGPLITTSIGIRVTQAGVNGSGAIGYYLDGSGDFGAYSTPIPTEGPAVLRGVIDIANGAVLTGYVAGALTPNHLDFTAPAAKVLTFATGSLAASAAGLKAATATVAAPVVLTASDLLAAGIAVILTHPRKLVFTTGGVTPADAPATVAIVGTRYGVAKSETLNLAQTAIAVSSVNTYDVVTSLSYPTADGTAATVAIGYTDAFANADEIVTAFNALAVAAPLAVSSRLYEDSTGTYLEIYSTSNGVGVTETIDDAASTADTPLGFTSAAANLTTIGTAATLPIPYVGATLTFPQGTYVLNDTYVLTTTGPGASTLGITNAVDTLRNSDFPFGYVVVLVPPSSAANCKTLCQALDAKVATWDTDDNTPIYVIQLTPGPLHTASQNQTTNNTNITANDTAVAAAFLGHTSIGTVVPDDGYRVGTKVLGSYRRAAALGVSYMLSRFLLSDDPGAALHGSIPEYSLTAPDGLTLARDQANPRTVVELGGSHGPGFTVLQNVNKLPRVKRGVTRAGSTSRLVDLGPGLRMGRRGQGVLYNTAKVGVENENFQTGPDGILLEGARTALEGAFTADLDAALLTPPLALNASSVTVTIVSTEVIANTNNITVTAILQKLGSAENVTITAIVAGVVQSTTLAG